MESNVPILVAIKCLVYNHEPFLRDCLGGFVMQKTKFRFVAIVHDDASTDGSANIIREYSEKYPDIIKPLYEIENQWSKHDGSLDRIVDDKLVATGAKYIAICEGDDYWTDPYKLQKQVDFMESHPDYSVCFHNYRNHIVKNDEYIDDTLPSKLLKQNNAIDGMDIDMDTYFSGWFTQPLTMLFRVSMYNFRVRDKYKYFRDMHDIYYLLIAGKGRLMPFVGAVRNVHEGGMSSMISNLQYCDTSLPIDREFYWKTRNKWSKNNYILTLDACVSVYCKFRKFRAFRCSFTRFLLTGHMHCFAGQMKMIFKK